MKKTFLSFFLLLLVIIESGWETDLINWTVEKHSGYNFFYTGADTKNKGEYLSYINNGIILVNNFFSASFKDNFSVYIFPDRRSLETQWKKDWNMPDFKSECWMVASGIASKLDMISPEHWDRESCEHSFKDKNSVQQIISHELVHVFHGQLNMSNDFSDEQGMDWFVEGLATFVSGQCDSGRVVEIKKAIVENAIPVSLDGFWTGKLRYALSGSMVTYIDSKYGRSKLKDLLKFNRKQDILDSLNISEKDLLAGWENFMNTLR